MKTVRIIFAIVLHIFFTSPTILVAEEHAIQRSERQTVEESPHWLQELKAHVKRLSHDIDTYHWTTTGKMNTGVTPLRTSDEVATKYIQKYLGYYNAPISPGRSDSAGPGLYLASDPVATLYYGGIKEWALMKIPFKKGLLYLDMRDDFEVPFSLEARKELKALGCEEHFPGGVIDVLRVDTMPRQPSCRALFVDAMKRLGVSLLAYTYTTQQYDGLATRPKTCFVLASDKDIEWKKLRTFTANTSFLSAADISDRAFINTAFRTALTNDEKLREQLPTLIPWPKANSTKKGDFIFYAREHFFGSDKYPEDGTVKGN